ncbi:MAG: bifunctional YncE family protein/alkaline phosphatase family protein [Candidatus Dormibacteraeota bacterium]|uniref:Bifunctional YncE family protein/alkaline phosphatase family protein n=1 Tax=Candidatus Amunia macphersoniae TaxID=3127014 RepID=A0A934NEM7_9BACT|nr:bifunctional YncE family protein/alkaline phosphatase family protein [Candidatus Dormibacteraeota bacterium]
MRTRTTLVAVIAALLGVASSNVLVSGSQTALTGAPVPTGATVLPSGRLVTPAGRSFNLGDFPVGLAISPDGSLAVAPGNGQGKGYNDGFGSLCQDAGRPNQCGYVPATKQGNPNTPSPDEALFVTDLLNGGQTRVVATPTSHDPAHPNFNFFAMGVAFSPGGGHLYATGGGNDALYDFTVAHQTLVSPPRTTYLQETNNLPTSSPTHQPPSNGVAGETKGLAITPDGGTLLVLKEQADALDLVRTSDLSLIQELPLGPKSADTGVGIGLGFGYPYAVTVAPDGARAYITMQGIGAVQVVTLPVAGAPAFLAAPVPAGDHPTGIAIASDGSTLMVANANDDTVSIISPSPAPALAQTLAVHAVSSQPVGSVPNAVAFAGPTRAYVALAGDDAVAILDRAGGVWSVTGYMPTGWYPVAVGVRAQTGEVLAVSAKGLGSRYISNGEYPAPAFGGPAALPAPYYYDGSNMPGVLSVIAPPSNTSDVASMSQQVRDDIAFASPPRAGQAQTAVPPPPGGQSPITHVLYVVRENRTFDQVFGDLGTTRSDVDANPNLETLAAATPNAHAMARQFGIGDAFFSDGEASIQGHYWTSSANVDDYVEKSWRQYYSPRNHPGDSVSTVSEPRGCSIFQAAQLKAASSNGSFTYKDYGEPTGVDNPTIDPTSAIGSILPPGTPVTPRAGQPASQCAPVPPTSLDPTFKNFLTGFSSDNRPLATDFLTDVGLNPDGTQTTQGQSGASFLRNFSYLVLPGDHTTGYGGANTPRAEVARNDAALGTVLSSLSKSKYWATTAVFVVEDDSQDGPDHIDGHRNVLLAASPYIKHLAADGCTAGYVGHDHYDQAGVLRTMELILGLPALSATDSSAAPLYDMFQPKNQASQLTADDLRPYEVTPAPPFIDETVASLPHTATNTALSSESASLDLRGIDLGGPKLEEVLWRSVRTDPIPEQLAAELVVVRAVGAEQYRSISQSTRTSSALGVGTLRGRFLAASSPKCPGHAIPESPWVALIGVAGSIVVATAVALRTQVGRRRRRSIEPGRI